MSKAKRIIQLAPISLATARVEKIDFDLAAFAVEWFSGLDNSVFLQQSENRDDPNAIELTEFKAQSWPEPWTQFYINIRTAQPGKYVVLTVGGPGCTISPGTKSTSSSANRSAIKGFVKTVGTSESALHTNWAIPAGLMLAIVADKDNDDANPVLIHAEGDTTPNVFTLYKGQSVELAVNNANVVWVTSAVDTNKLHCIAEA